MQRTKSLHVDNVFRPHAASEMQLLRDKCQWYIRKYDESTRQAATLKTQLGVVDKEWDSKLQAMQDEFERLQKRNEVLEKENERLLGVIASLKKIPKRKPLPPKKECVICVEEKLFSDYPQSGHFKDHEICGECVARYMKTRILDDGLTSVLCPESGCKAPLEYSEIGQHASKDVFARYDELLCRRAFETEPNFRWCTNRVCEAGQIVSNGASTSFYACAMCTFRSCFKCKTPAHMNFTCEQARAARIRREHNGEEVASTTWLGANTRECYTCHRQCHKEIGCDHITCICGAEWCWLCGAKYKDIRKEGNTAHKKGCRHYA